MSWITKNFTNNLFSSWKIIHSTIKNNVFWGGGGVGWVPTLSVIVTAEELKSDDCLLYSTPSTNIKHSPSPTPWTKIDLQNVVPKL